MKSIRLLYIVLLLIVADLGCRRKESDSGSIKIMPSKARGEALDRTLLHLAPNWEVAERLINEGVDVNAKDSFGMTPLHTAVQAGRKDVVKVLVAHGANINEKSNRSGCYPRSQRRQASPGVSGDPVWFLCQAR
ncbi:ankyrin repeat domain-containing protein [Planctomycetota bacterium]